MSRILELVLFAVVPLMLSAFSAPREMTPDDELSAITENRAVDHDGVVADQASELDGEPEVSSRQA